MANIFFPEGNNDAQDAIDPNKQAFDLTVAELYKTAPAAAKFVEDSYGFISDFTGKKMLTFEDAWNHYTVWQQQQEQLPHGRPITTGADNAQARAERQLRLEQSRTTKQESKARYEARLAKYLRRRVAIAQAKQAVIDAFALKRTAIAQMNDQWDAYIAHLRTTQKDMELIHADDWPD